MDTKKSNRGGVASPVAENNFILAAGSADTSSNLYKIRQHIL